jgi:hypothetical protein
MFTATARVRAIYYSLLAGAFICFFLSAVAPNPLRLYLGCGALVAWLSSAVVGMGSHCPGCNCPGLYRFANGYYALWFPSKCEKCGYDYDEEK